MKSILVIIGAVAIAGATVGAARHTTPTSKLDGKSIFVTQRCDKCHSVESAGIVRSATPPGKLPPDLSSTGLRHNAAWFSGWLMKTEELNGKKHIKKWSGTPADLATESAWLATLKRR